MFTKRLEASVVHSITTQLENLKWVVNEKDPHCNVTQQRLFTVEQQQLLKGKRPDFVLYESPSKIRPVAIIEAKRPSQSLSNALKQAEELYARPLQVPLIFAYNDTYVETKYLFNGRSLKIDGEDVRQFIDHYTALRFINEGSEILSAPQHVQYSREQLIQIFRHAADLLREAGLQAGLERFGAFSDILFLKIMDEVCMIQQHAGEPTTLPEYIRWTYFQNMPPEKLHQYIKNVVWVEMNHLYGAIFSETIPVDSAIILHEIVQAISSLNLTASDTDVKGDAFEYFLKNAYQGLSIKDLGEYFTPRNIVRTMVSMVNPQIGEKVYDPFCGTGGFLIECFKYLRIRMKSNQTLERILKHETVFGSEITSNARIAKMNMILFGDGHNNIFKQDSFAFPQTGKFDICLTNPPYSQKTRYGDLYPVSAINGDAMCIMHCFDSLNDHGRAAILVKEDFLTKSGSVGQVRDYILKHAKNFTVVSLPRRLFEPYTPTKTSIIYFEKAGTRHQIFFYMVNHVGHTLSARKKMISENDLPTMLDGFNAQHTSSEIHSCVVEQEDIINNHCSLWAYDYLELYPSSSYPMGYLGDFIEEQTQKINPQDFPNEEFQILGCSNQFGIFENELLLGEEIRQQYKQVRTGDLVYNPHRVNVGSIGLVTQENDGGYVSGIYVVFRTIHPQLPPEYILWLLKSEHYLRIIRAYDSRYGAVRANLTYEMLCRIKIPLLTEKELQQFVATQQELETVKRQVSQQEAHLATVLTCFTGKQIISQQKRGMR